MTNDEGEGGAALKIAISLILNGLKAETTAEDAQKKAFQAAAERFLSAWEPFFAAWERFTAAWEGFQAAWKAFFPAWKGSQAAGEGFFWPRERLQGGKKGVQAAGKVFAAAWKGFKWADWERKIGTRKVNFDGVSVIDGGCENSQSGGPSKRQTNSIGNGCGVMGPDKSCYPLGWSPIMGFAAGRAGQHIPTTYDQPTLHLR